jgi:TatD DNase family protein
MGKNSKAKKLGEGVLAVPVHTQLVGSTVPLVDTHTHVLSTFDAYRAAYPAGAHADVFALARGLLAPRGVRTLVDVWCEAPVLPAWRELADAGEKWGDINYRFVMGMSNKRAGRTPC